MTGRTDSTDESFWQGLIKLMQWLRKTRMYAVESRLLKDATAAVEALTTAYHSLATLHCCEHSRWQESKVNLSYLEGEHGGTHGRGASGRPSLLISYESTENMEKYGAGWILHRPNWSGSLLSVGPHLPRPRLLSFDCKNETMNISLMERCVEFPVILTFIIWCFLSLFCLTVIQDWFILPWMCLSFSPVNFFSSIFSRAGLVVINSFSLFF